MLERIDAGRDGRGATSRVLGVNCQAPAGFVHCADDRGQDLDRNRRIIDTPVGDQLCPPGPGSLCCGQCRQVRVVGSSGPAVEELAMLRDPLPA